MARTWLVDGRGIARKVKNATSSSNCQVKEWGAGVDRECPNCQHTIDNSDVSIEWPGLPAGVKFDPSDLELIDHLAGKVGLENSKSHPLIDEFIQTLEENEGICYTHPENLPGVRKDGNSTHFFHRTSNAYSTGCRKRRKIYGNQSASEEHVRWHKTGKTKPVMDNGIQKGCKKIMVLYKSSKKLKPDKTNWVMHQYHLGTEEDEKNGEYVVSKIFYQQQSSQMEKNDMVAEMTQVITSSRLNSEEPVLVVGNGVDPKTPKMVTPDPPKLRPWTTYEDDEDVMRLDSPQNTNLAAIWTDHSIHVTEDAVIPIRLAGESQVECINSTQLLSQSKAAEDLDASLLCHEVLESYQTVEVPGSDMFQCFMGFDPNTDTGIPDLDTIGTCTPPDFNLSDLQFGSQESTMSWIDRL